MRVYSGQIKFTKGFTLLPRGFVPLESNFQLIGVHMKFKINQIYNLSIYGKVQPVKILAVHPMGTIDVETLSGKCFRLSGF